MRYVLICEDNPHSLERRLANREKHLAYIRALGDTVRLAGPLLDDDGETMVGSLFILEADSVEDVAAIHAHDPYTRAGLFGRVTIRPFRQVIPAP